MVEHNLAKVGVAGSSPVSRSIFSKHFLRSRFIPQEKSEIERVPRSASKRQQVTQERCQIVAKTMTATETALGLGPGLSFWSFGCASSLGMWLSFGFRGMGLR